MAQQIEIAYKKRRAMINKEGELIVYLGNNEPSLGPCNEIKYLEIATGTTETLWQPATGSAVRLDALVTSMDGAGDVEIFFGTRLVTHLEFSEKKAVPMPINYPVCVGLNTALRVTATGANAYVSAIGFEVVI